MIERIAIDLDRVPIVDPTGWQVTYKVAQQLSEDHTEICRVQIEVLRVDEQ